MPLLSEVVPPRAASKARPPKPVIARPAPWLGVIASLALLAAGSGSATAQCTPEWLPDDGFDVLGPGPASGSSPVTSMKGLANGDVVVSGWFLTAGSTTVNHIARWDGLAWRPLGAGLNGQAHALTTLQNGDLIAGGTFSTAGGGAANNIARWDGTAWWQLGAGLNGTVYALATLPNGDLVAGGNFSVAGGGAANNIARWDGSSWSPMGIGPNNGLNGTVGHLAVLQNGDVVAAGPFTAAGGVPASMIARWDGTNWLSLGAGLTGAPQSGVWSLVVMPNGNLVAAGTFSAAGGVAVNGFAQWDGGTWTSLAAGPVITVAVAFMDLTVTASGSLMASVSWPLPGVQSDIWEWDGTAWSLIYRSSADSVGHITSAPGSHLIVTGSEVNGSGWIRRWGCPTGIASNTSYGAGCGRLSQAFYEHFTVPPGQFDLSQSTLQLTFTGTGYQVTHVPGAPAWFNPASPALPLTDDSTTGPMPLTFYLPSPGTWWYDQISVNSNGLVDMTDNPGMPSPFYDSIGTFLYHNCSCPLWGDWDPATGTGAGFIYYDVVPGQAAYVTWDAVQVYGAAGNTATFQLAVFANGNLEFRYKNCVLGGLPALVGRAPIGFSADPGSRDLSTAGSFQTSPDQAALAHQVSPRPYLGAVALLETYQIPPSSPMGGTLLSMTAHDPGISLAPVGMPGCTLANGADVIDLFLPSSAGVGSYSLPIPINQALIGLHVYSQGFAFVPGFNAFGGITSNGLDLKLGLP